MFLSQVILMILGRLRGLHCVLCMNANKCLLLYEIIQQNGLNCLIFLSKHIGRFMYIMDLLRTFLSD